MNDYLYYHGCYFLLNPGTGIDLELFRKLDEIYEKYYVEGLLSNNNLSDKMLIINLRKTDPVDRTYHFQNYQEDWEPAWKLNYNRFNII